jgi:hypothetical protein
MNEKTGNKVKKEKRLLKGTPMMLLSLVVVFVVVPMAFIKSYEFTNVMRAAGVVLNPNINDGSLIAEFEDPAGDLLRSVPEGKNFRDAAGALDIRKFAVKKVKFHPLSGIGIEPRLNLVFHFDGILPNPLQSKHGFSLPVFHVYINVPGESRHKVENKESDKTAAVLFAGEDWDYQVVVDGLHEQARIYDGEGKLMGKGLGLYIKYIEERLPETDVVGTKLDVVKDKKAQPPKIKKSTRITAALPMEILGDPSRGEWFYYVAVGLADFRSPSLMYPPLQEGEMEIFDCVLPPGAEAVKTAQGIPELPPLKVGNKKQR